MWVFVLLSVSLFWVYCLLFVEFFSHSEWCTSHLSWTPGSSLAPTRWHKRSPSNLLLTAHRWVHHLFAHGLLNWADGLVAWSIRNRLLELRVELADGQTVATLHFLYRVVEFLFQSIGEKYLLKMADDWLTALSRRCAGVSARFSSWWVSSQGLHAHALIS